MKELKLDIGKGVKINNLYAYNIIVKRREKGYTLETDKEKFGPYLKVFFERSAKHNNDTFITCYNLDKSVIYRMGLYGLEVSEVIDTSMQASKMLNKMFNKDGKIEIEGCTLLGVENGYSVFVDESDNKFFVVNNKETVTSIEGYEKFETYKELVNYYKTKGIKVYDQEIARLSKDAFFIDFNGLKQIVKDFKFENISHSLQYSLKGARPFDENVIDFDFLVEELKEDNKIIKIKKIKLKNDINFEKELNENGFYRIDNGTRNVDFNYFIKNNPKQYKQLCAEFEEKYYEMLATVTIEDGAKQNIKKFLKADFRTLTLKFAKEDKQCFTLEMFEILLKDISDMDHYGSLWYWGRNGLTARWLKIVSPDTYNELWNKCENAFLENKQMLIEVFGDSQ